MQGQGWPLKQGLTLFWSVWLALVCLSNACDGLQTLNLLGGRWTFASGNEAALHETTRQYALPPRLTGLLFLGIILWQAGAALLFWSAGSAWHDRHVLGLSVRNIAFLSKGA
ncbi:MAG: hypothetical protein AB7N91_15005 [Candidatus Tectimicrobiota bacterium]